MKNKTIIILTIVILFIAYLSTFLIEEPKENYTFNSKDGLYRYTFEYKGMKDIREEWLDSECECSACIIINEGKIINPDWTCKNQPKQEGFTCLQWKCGEYYIEREGSTT